MTLLQKADRFSPPIARLLAYKNGRLMTHAEVAKASGLSWATVQRLSARKTYAGVNIDVVDRFLKACGIDPLNAGKKLFQLDRMCRYKGGFASARHLKPTANTPLWVKAMQAKQIKRFIKLMS